MSSNLDDGGFYLGMLSKSGGEPLNDNDLHGPLIKQRPYLGKKPLQKKRFRG